MKIFLGGTCNGSEWRDELIPKLKVDFFNPVVADWNEEAMRLEIQERENCDICLYVITPKTEGFYGIAEVTDDSNKRAEKTMMCILPEDGPDQFSSHQLKSLRKVGRLVQENGGVFCEGMQALLELLDKRTERQAAS